MKTAGAPYAIRLSPDRKAIASDGKDISFITAEVVDKDGNVCPKASQPLTVKVEGNGRFLAMCNGDPIDYTPFSSDTMRLFNGKLVILVDSPSRERGPMTVSVTGPRLKMESQSIEVKNLNGTDRMLYIP